MAILELVNIKYLENAYMPRVSTTANSYKHGVCRGGGGALEEVELV